MFQPGNKLGGRSKHVLNGEEIRTLVGRFWRMTRRQVSDVFENEHATMGEIMVAGIMVKAAKEGDAHRLSFLLDRAVGKVKEEVELSAKLTKLTDEQLLEIAREHIKQLESKVIDV